MSFHKYMDASTRYITKEDNAILEADVDCPVSLYEYEYGYFVHTGGFTDKEVKEAGFSDEFLALLTYAADNDCWFLRLDADGDDTLDFPTFEW